MAERLSIEIQLDILKVDESLVFAWGMICSKDGEPYRDLDRERFTTDEMLKAVTEVGSNAVRPTDEMHDGEPNGTVVHSFPMTHEIAAVYGIKCDTEGWMVVVKPSADVLAKFVSGEYTGFSVGGSVERWEADDDDRGGCLMRTALGTDPARLKGLKIDSLCPVTQPAHKAAVALLPKRADYDPDGELEKAKHLRTQATHGERGRDS